MVKKIGVWMVSILLLQYSLEGSAGWRDWLDKLRGKDSSSSSTQASKSLSSSDVIAGLREALQKSSDLAVGLLGKEGGFLQNPQVKIPMPESLRRVEGALRKIGAERYADEFVVSMNRAAERAVTVAKPIFTRTIREMTIEDGMIILRGGDDAATRYFREKTESELTRQMMPITHEMTEKSGVTSNYKKMISKLSFASRWVSKDAQDIDAYITQKALDGLFLVIAEEEKKIRTNPVSRTTELLKKVFGSSAAAK